MSNKHISAAAKVIIPKADLPENYTAIVTGGQAGLGYEVGKYLALLGARVIIACKNEINARAAMLRIQADVMEIRGAMTTLEEDGSDSDDKEEVSEIGPPPSERDTFFNQPLQLEFIKLDVDSLKSVKQFVDKFKALEYPLHLIVCSEAVINIPQEYTDDGYERHFQHNYLSHSLLSMYLLPSLKQHREDARIVLMASTSHTSGEFNLKNMQGKANYNKSKCFANSQLYVIMFMYSLQRRLEGSNVSVFAAHNGAVDTLLKKEDDPAKWGTFYTVARTMGKIVKNTSKSVNNCLSVAISPALKDLRGHFFAGGIPVTASQTAKDVKSQEVLWRYTLDALKEHVTQSDLADLRLSEDLMKELGIDDTM